jgi:hypothetical protein
MMPALTQRKKQEARSNKQQATSNKQHRKFRAMLLETLEQRSLFAADLLNNEWQPTKTAPISDLGQTEEPKQRLLKVKESLSVGNEYRFETASKFSTLIAEAQTGADVSPSHAANAAWSDFGDRTTNIPSASKSAFELVQGLSKNPSVLQSKLLQTELGVRSLDTSPLDSSSEFGPAVPTAQLVMQHWSAPILSGIGNPESRGFATTPPFIPLTELTLGGFCREDGMVMNANGNVIGESNLALLAEGEGDGDGSLVPNVNLPQLEASNYSSSISTYQPSTNSNGLTTETRGGFTLGTTKDSDLTIPGINFVHTIDRLWIDALHWSVTESLIFAFNITETVPLPADNDSASSGSGNSGSGDSGGSQNPPPDISQTHTVQSSSTVSATVTRVGFVILVFHAERGITTPADAGVKWSLSVNYADAITIAIAGGGGSTVTPNIAPNGGSTSSGTGSNGNGGSSGGNGSGGTPIDPAPLPSDFQATSTYSISASVTARVSGSFSMGATPAIVPTGVGNATAIDTTFYYDDTVSVGGNVLLGGSWQSSSSSGNLNAPSVAPNIDPPVELVDALALGGSTPSTNLPPAGAISVPPNGIIAIPPSAGDLRSPDLGSDVPMNRPVGHGHQSGSSGGFNANLDASSSGGLHFAGKIRNGTELQSLTGSLRSGLKNKYGDGDRENEILVFSDGATTQSAGTTSFWNGTIMTGTGMDENKLVDIIGDITQAFELNSDKELEVDPGAEIEKVIGGGGEKGTDFETIIINSKSLQTSPTLTVFNDTTLIEARFNRGNSGGSVKVENDAADSGELKAEWNGDGYQIQDVKATLMTRETDPSGHKVVVTRDHDIWQLVQSETGNTTTTVAGDGDPTSSGTAGVKTKESISYNSLFRWDEDYAVPQGRTKFDTLRIGKFNKTYENGATADASTGVITPSESTTGDSRVSVTGHWLMDIWRYYPSGELEYYNWDHMPDIATGEGTFCEVYYTVVNHYDTTNYDPRNSYEHALDGSPDPNPPPPAGQPPEYYPSSYPSNPYTGNTWIAWFGGTAGDGVDQVFNVAYGFGDGATFGLSKVIRQSTGLDRADYDGNAYFGGEMLSAFVPSPTAIAKQGTVAWKLYNKFDDSGKCASMLTKLVHGKCFAAGTKVTLSEIPYSDAHELSVWSDADWLGENDYASQSQNSPVSLRTSLLVPIEQVSIGSRVPTKNPRRWDYDFSLPEPNEATWKRFSLTALDDEGAMVEAEFIRPIWWMEENGIAAGAMMPLAIEELGLSGFATIRTVEDCGPIARGDGSVVTGRFTTSRVNVIVRLTVAGPDGTVEVLEGTTVHPTWSVDRNDWIQLSELQEGERLQAADGIVTVVSVAIVNTNVPVHNLEVHGEHVYQVGELGLLVHNSYADDLAKQAGDLVARNKLIRRKLLGEASERVDDLQRSMPTNAIDAMGFDEVKQLRIQAAKDGLEALRNELKANDAQIDTILRMLGF